ncbi:MAG TPA: glycosyl hydrolase family 79 C-terminal domain-containing protein [Steroidobacteraceae bacterium]|nr:glycosyl hydrolase family 79 C-terminal domain-containing protein [Steroidobacteraceae bacterium]
MDRRKFLAGSLAVSYAALAAPAGSAGFGSGSGRRLRLTVHANELGNPIAADFTGLSYETSQLSDPTFFSPANGVLAGFHRHLGAAGVLRIGGNTSEFGVWSPNAVPTPPAPEALGPDTGRHPAPHRPVTPLAIRNLRGFLELSGWRLIYGLNMGSESPETVADEAAYVAGVMGDKLVAFQLCNEPDLFHRNGLRPPDYGYPQFAAEWRRYFHAVRQRVPHAPFAGPDTADNSEWLLRFAHDLRHEVAFLSQHYYAEGPPTDPSMTIERLLGPSTRLQADFKAAAAARKDTGLHFRMAETNSCYQGGKPGVSDTFASALWGADLMYQLAQAGATGVNFHGGGYGWYTPVAGTRENGFVARPIYYGMLLFAVAGTGRLVTTELGGEADGSVSAYGLQSGGDLKVVILNKNLEDDVILTVDAPGTGKATVLRLVAPRVEETTDVTFGGSVVGDYGGWAPTVAESVAARQGSLSLHVPKAGAALVTLSG